MANEIEKVNTLTLANIEKINTRTDANIQDLNTLEMTGFTYNGITWSTDDVTPAAFGYPTKFGNIGAQGVLNGGTKATYEHDGSSWSTTGSCSGSHLLTGSGGTQSAGVVFGGYSEDTGVDSVITEEYNGSTWSTGNNMVGGFAFGTGSGTVQTACLATGGSTYTPTVRDIPLTQTYNGTNWANESVDSSGQGSGTGGESGGGGLDAYLSASGSYDAGTTSDCQLFNQSAGSWTSKAAVNTIARYTGSSTDGTRVYKIGGYNQPHFAVTVVVESWVENAWTTENSLPLAMNNSGTSGGLEAAGGASSIGGSNASGATDSYYISVAS